MSERVLALIWIGGRLDVSRADVLIAAINKNPVFAHVGDVDFQPTTAIELTNALTPDGHLYLCDDVAAGGDMPEIKRACYQLDLSYRLWHEPLNDFGSIVEM